MAENKEEMTFEQKLLRLTEIANKMEGETLPLDVSLALHEEAQALIKDLQNTLKEAEKKAAKVEEA